MAIVKWFDPASTYAPAQVIRPIAIDWTKDKDAYILRAARDTDPAANVFNPASELADLWETLKRSGHNVSSINLCLFGGDIDPNTGNGVRIEAAIRNPEKPEFGHAYEAKQLAAFAPAHFFMGANTSLRGAPPWFSCAVLPYKGKVRKGNGRTPRQAPPVVRMTAAPATPQVTRARRGS